MTDTSHPARSAPSPAGGVRTEQASASPVQHRVEAVIDLGAFRNNVRRLVDVARPASVMLAVKANAYGHGMLEMATAALDAGATSLAVLDIPAGCALRDAGIAAPVLAWLHAPESDFAAAVRSGIDLGISAEWQLDAIAAAGRPELAQVHLKIDTGLSRNGASVENWPALVDRARQLQDAGVLHVRGIWSHLADASHADDADALARLHAAVAVAADRGVVPDVLHLAASSAGIEFPDARLDLVRFGIAAYGISPFDDRSGADLLLTPTMTLRSRVTRVDDRSATVCCGYADGVLPLGRGRASVLVRGRRHDVTAIGPDELTIRLDQTPEAGGRAEVRGGAAGVRGATGDVRVGDEVLVFGPGSSGEPTAEEWASWCDTIGDEVVTCVSARVPRRYVD